ncbi:MAG: phospho-sugar mutase [Ruminococcaceae bacterium]|nr:phospho-sugar mutase [Oscillospiraceae bacterium]MBO4971317.1 phospho-sugar mutase [Clostridia bacterium]MBQ1260194.1 phospho-sugar mutase [Clostridia bacterium]
MEYRSLYEKWLTLGSAEERAELEAIKDDEKEIKHRFSSYINFGTGGLRGFMNAGTNAMNLRTVALATQAICDLIAECGRKEDGIVVGYDSRNNSEAFAKKTASVAAANGVKTYIFDALRPTPELSFAIRELGCVAGVNITASHNPKEYNGYKAYWDDGAQLPPEHAETVAERMKQIDVFEGVLDCDFDKAVSDGSITVIGSELDEIYMKNVIAERIYPEVVEKVADDLRIVYTPLHGAGRILVPEVLRRTGIKHIYTVDEQMIPDGNFPTVKKPNPENADVFAIGIDLAKKVGSDLVIATDPDADRVGVMIRKNDGSFITITGNQMGAMLLEYILCAYEETGTMPVAPYAVKTIVTTPIAEAICKAHGVKLFNVLTGFKFIGEVIKEQERKDEPSTFVFGFEESYGYLKGTYARDKDSVVAAMLISEMTCFYKLKGQNLYDVLCALYDKYGYHLEKNAELVFAGHDGSEKMSAIMQKLRNAPPESLGGKRIVQISDYLTKKTTDLLSGKVTPTDLPVSNVLYFVLEGDDIVVIRPSGTEPKIKIYYLLSASSHSEAYSAFEVYKKDFESLV